MRDKYKRLSMFASGGYHSVVESDKISGDFKKYVKDASERISPTGKRIDGYKITENKRDYSGAWRVKLLKEVEFV